MAWRGGTLRRVTGSAGSEPMPAGPLQTSGEAVTSLACQANAALNADTCHRAIAVAFSSGFHRAMSALAIPLISAVGGTAEMFPVRLMCQQDECSAARRLRQDPDPDSELARLQGATLGDEWAEERVPAPQSDAIEVSDDDTVRLPQRHLGIWHAFGRAIRGDEGLHLA